MTERRPYTYVLLRYRHDALSGEFANVGVLLHEPRSGFFKLRARQTVGRLRAMFPGISVDAYRRGIRAIERGARQAAEREATGLFSSVEDAGSLGLKFLPRDESSFVWGAIGSGVTVDALADLDKLYARFVTRYDAPGRVLRDDADVWRPVREKLAERKIADRLEPVVIRSPLDDVRFDHAWKNGAWHCYQPISFDLLQGDSIRDKAAKWAGQLLALEHSSEPFKAYFLVGAPSSPKLRSDYERAIGILKLRSPEVVEEAEIDTLIDRIEADIREHDAA